MWTCSNCDRAFKRTNQPHSCKIVPIESHFKNKLKAKELFDYLLRQIEKNIGKCKIISLPCCVHLFGTYDFLAVLPQKNDIEIRFALDHIVDTPRLKAAVPMSGKVFKNCFTIDSKQEINSEFMGWIKKSYYFKS
jgi:hypothetical protein